MKNVKAVKAVTVFYKNLNMEVQFHWSGAVYVTDHLTGDGWAYGSQDSFEEDMRAWFARRGYQLGACPWAGRAH